MSIFKKVETDKGIRQTISSTFDVELALDGGWGYTQEQATTIESLKAKMSLSQVEHMLTTMRAHLEMNIMQIEANRYGGINANERARELIRRDRSIFDKVTYEITGIKENLYHAFIKEYKEGYETIEFDLADHFKRRKAATLIREVVHYFEVSSIS